MLRGFWEQSTTDGQTLTLWCWGYDDQGQALQWALSDGTVDCHPASVERFERSDVASVYPDAPQHCGFRLRFGAGELAGLQRVATRLVLTTCASRSVCPHSPKDAVWNALCFACHDDFAIRVQNPATRIKATEAQIFCCLVALADPASDRHTTAGAQVVLMYRGLFGEWSDERRLHALSHQVRRHLAAMTLKVPMDLRWKVSLGMALGYLLLARGEIRAAMQAFEDVWSAREELSVWPAMATNVVTALLLVAVLKPQRQALDALREVPALMRHVIETAPLTNFYHYEEHRNLLAVCAQAAVLHARHAEVPGWAGPGEVDLGRIAHIPAPVKAAIQRALEPAPQPSAVPALSPAAVVAPVSAE